MTDNNKGVPKMENIPPMPKPRLHKLNPASFKEQVESLPDTDLISLRQEIETEMDKRKKELKNRLNLLGEEGK